MGVTICPDVVSRVVKAFGVVSGFRFGGFLGADTTMCAWCGVWDLGSHRGLGIGLL